MLRGLLHAIPTDPSLLHNNISEISIIVVGSDVVPFLPHLGACFPISLNNNSALLYGNCSYATSQPLVSLMLVCMWSEFLKQTKKISLKDSFLWISCFSWYKRFDFYPKLLWVWIYAHKGKFHNLNIITQSCTPSVEGTLTLNRMPPYQSVHCMSLWRRHLQHGQMLLVSCAIALGASWLRTGSSPTRVPSPLTWRFVQDLMYPAKRISCCFLRVFMICTL
jgi:hypothetical protein